jgi:glucosyl-glycerol phosphate synthase (EC 2.4.1.213)
MLLATDLDGTFLAGSPEARARLHRLVSSHPDISLVFVTGRGLESVMPLIGDPTMPTPDYVICDVGATIVTGADEQAVQPLQAQIDALWPGEQTVHAAFADLINIERQEVPQDRRCSYFCKPEAVDEEIERRARELGVDVLYSADRYLDILPRGVNKGSTLRKLVEQLGIPEQDVLVAGDTLNDLAMFTSGFKGVCVGNSEPGLLEATRHLGNTFHAREAGAGGILEALGHFGFLGPKGVAASVPQTAKPGKAELVMVYHRLPYEEYVEDGETKRRPPSSPNGIIPTLLSFFRDGRPGSWVAWQVQDPKAGALEPHTPVDEQHYPGLVAARVGLTKREVDIFYKIFSKEAFWPTLHTFWERAIFREAHWQVFLKVNHKFAEATAAEAAPGATVWIHDYNLWMVPAYLRELRPDLRIAFFHHTYFPSADIFNVLPWRRQILGSLMHCDYVGFHIPRQVANFLDAVRGTMPVQVLERVQCAPRFLTYGCAVGLDEMPTRIESAGREVGIGAHPVGIDINRIQAILEREETRKRMAELREELAGRRMVLSVERLDYTKGTLEKLLAFERLLAEHPELHRKVVLTAICVPAAPEMSVYRNLQIQIEEAVGRVNGRFSEFNWTPVRFFARALPFDEVVAYYAMADVMWITPLRDGLNLVCKEYVGTQGLMGGRGVLVLSEFAGAAAELKGAILTNPHDAGDLYQGILRGITLGQAEATARLRDLFEIVRYHDVQRWGDEFLAAVGHGSVEGESVSETPPASPQSA